MNTFEFKNLVKNLKNSLKEKSFFKDLRKEVDTGANGTQNYVVKKGDSLYSIARELLSEKKENYTINDVGNKVQEIIKDNPSKKDITELVKSNMNISETDTNELITTIENELESQRSISQDPANGDDYELLQKAMETMTNLESEYLELMEEQENILIER